MSSLTKRASAAMDPESNRMKASEKMLKARSEGKGWRDALETGLIEQQKLKRDDQMIAQLEKTANIEKYGFDDFGALLQEMLDELENGMTAAQRVRLAGDRFMGGTTAATIDKQKETAQRKLRIIKEINPHERRWPKLLNRAARLDIASKLDVELVHVEELLFEYQIQYAQWAFLRREKLRGRPLPQNSSDLEWMMKARPTKEFVQFMRAFEKKKSDLEKARKDATGA